MYIFLQRIMFDFLQMTAKFEFAWLKKAFVLLKKFKLIYKRCPNPLHPSLKLVLKKKLTEIF